MQTDSSNVEFTLPYLSSSYTMLQDGTLDDPVTGIVDSSAVAVFYMAQSDVNQIFRFQADSLDFSDTAYSDLHYLIYMDRWPSSLILNPSNAMLDQQQSSTPILQVGIPEKMLVKHDFIRYLSDSLFNTPHGVDLFNNETQLIQHMNTLGYTAWQNDISGGLWKYASTSDTPVSSGFVIEPVSGLKATTDDLPMDDNIGRYMMNKLLQNNPHRFRDLVLDEEGQAPIPIYTGDTFRFKFTVYPAENQHMLTGVAPLSGRAYEIRIVIDEGTNVNTVSDDDTLLNTVYTRPPLTFNEIL